MVVPGWYGLGGGMRAAREAGYGAALDEMRQWAFFSNVLGDVEMTLAKTDLRIAGLYVTSPSWSTPRCSRPATASRPSTRGRGHEVLRLLEAACLLSRHPVLRHTLALRAADLEPRHHLQVELLARRRRVAEPDPDLHRRCCSRSTGSRPG